MKSLNHLFENNRRWSDRMREQDPTFFTELARQQNPQFLWIGCSDSRVPANQIVGLLPGELFVHRNVANLVVHTDLNCLTVLQFAIDILNVRHVIVCGHYGCSGVRAAMRGDRIGLADNWLRHLQDVRQKHAARMSAFKPDSCSADAQKQLCELNVIEQVVNVCQTTIARDAWARGQELSIHGWIYGIENGQLRDMKITVDRESAVESTYDAALSRLDDPRAE